MNFSNMLKILDKSEAKRLKSMVLALEERGYTTLSLGAEWPCDYEVFPNTMIKKVKGSRTERIVNLKLAYNDMVVDLEINPTPSGKFNFFGAAIDIVNLFKSKEA